MVMLLTNSQRIDFSQSVIEETVNESVLKWYSFLYTYPHTNRISF
jgi:hypothetical protein